MTRVPVSEFVFVVRLSGCQRVQEVLGEVASNVFRHVGCTSTAVTELAAQLSSIIDRHRGDAAELQVAFHAHPGSCDVVVTTRDGEIWRMNRFLP
jgi:hypothetical protein